MTDSDSKIYIVYKGYKIQLQLFYILNNNLLTLEQSYLLVYYYRSFQHIFVLSILHYSIWVYIIVKTYTHELPVFIAKIKKKYSNFF